MKARKATLTDRVLSVLLEIGEILPRPFETPYSYIKRAGGVSKKKYRRTVHDLEKRGILEISRKHGDTFIRLTQKGELQALLKFARLDNVKAWDGKWRLIIFDIPEQARDKRNQLRALLKKEGFVKLQASVFISARPLNRAAVEYLKKTRLIGYIRILRVDEIDDDKDLRAHFKIKTKVRKFDGRQ